MAQTLLALALVAIGLALAAWLALVAHDIRTHYRRFSKALDRPGRADAPTRAAAATRPAARADREAGVV